MINEDSNVKQAWKELLDFWKGYGDELGKTAKSYDELRDDINTDTNRKSIHAAIEAIFSKDEIIANKTKHAGTLAEYLKPLVHPQDLEWMKDNKNFAPEHFADLACNLLGLYKLNKIDFDRRRTELHPVLPQPFYGSLIKARVISIYNNPGYDPRRDPTYTPKEAKTKIPRLFPTSKNLDKIHPAYARHSENIRKHYTKGNPKVDYADISTTFDLDQAVLFSYHTENSDRWSLKTSVIPHLPYSGYYNDKYLGGNGHPTQDALEENSNYILYEKPKGSSVDKTPYSKRVWVNNEFMHIDYLAYQSKDRKNPFVAQIYKLNKQGILMPSQQRVIDLLTAILIDHNGRLVVARDPLRIRRDLFISKLSSENPVDNLEKISLSTIYDILLTAPTFFENENLPLGSGKFASLLRGLFAEIPPECGDTFEKASRVIKAYSSSNPKLTRGNIK
ncbi:hypothetical protein ACUH94_05055 [Dermabacteraceae bacterium P7074]